MWETMGFGKPYRILPLHHQLIMTMIKLDILISIPTFICLLGNFNKQLLGFSILNLQNFLNIGECTALYTPFS